MADENIVPQIDAAQVQTALLTLMSQYVLLHDHYWVLILPDEKTPGWMAQIWDKDSDPDDGSLASAVGDDLNSALKTAYREYEEAFGDYI